MIKDGVWVDVRIGAPGVPLRLGLLMVFCLVLSLFFVVVLLGFEFAVGLFCKRPKANSCFYCWFCVGLILLLVSFSREPKTK